MDWNDPTRGPSGKLIGLEGMMLEETLKEPDGFVQPLEQKAEEQLPKWEGVCGARLFSEVCSARPRCFG